MMIIIEGQPQLKVSSPRGRVGDMILTEKRIEDDSFVIFQLGRSEAASGNVEVYKLSSNTTDMSSCRGSYPTSSKEPSDSAELRKRDACQFQLPPTKRLLSNQRDITSSRSRLRIIFFDIADSDGEGITSVWGSKTLVANHILSCHLAAVLFFLFNHRPHIPLPWEGVII